MGICAPARPVYEGAEYIYQYEKSYAGKSPCVGWTRTRWGTVAKQCQQSNLAILV